MDLPAADRETGLFEPVFGRAPESWPWALPHLCAINFAKVQERGRVEVLGYWAGAFHVVDVATMEDLATARESAERDFAQLPIRLLLDHGVIVRKNKEVHITGTWPSSWDFVRVQDLGVLSAFVFDLTQVAEPARSRQFCSMIAPAFPATEQLIVYLEALRFAERELASALPRHARTALHEGISTAERWLRRS